jgi:CMP-N-acetylneuraminic acid synthetase
MHRTVAVIVVRNPKVFSWLGHMPIMNWLVSQLREVRGVDRAVCCASADLTKQAVKLLSKEDIETVEIPANVAAGDERHFDKWLCAAGGPADDADVVAVLKPTSPFLPAPKIEACIDLVRRNIADTCCTVQEVAAWTSQGRTQAYAEVPGCRAYAPARAVERPSCGRFRPVPVTIIESLDVSDPDSNRLARAFVADGSAL